MRVRRIATAMAALAFAWFSSAAPSSGQVRAGAGHFSPTALEGRLVRLRDGLIAPAASRKPHYTAIYFGASWCGPCRAFAPELRAAYPRLRSRGAEVVFFSDDADCRRMSEYVRTARMPWPVVACRERARLPALQRARGAALPGLLVYDAEGRLVLSSWSGSGRSRPREALAELERLAGVR